MNEKEIRYTITTYTDPLELRITDEASALWEEVQLLRTELDNLRDQFTEYRMVTAEWREQIEHNLIQIASALQMTNPDLKLEVYYEKINNAGIRRVYNEILNSIANAAHAEEPNVVPFKR